LLDIAGYFCCLHYAHIMPYCYQQKQKAPDMPGLFV
jgi:hypothetical protein